MLNGSTTEPTGLTDEFTAAIKALDVIEQRLPFITNRDELGQAMCDAVELGHTVHALQARLALACTTNNVAAVSGQRTIGQYVAARTNTQAIAIDRLSKTAKWLRDFPRFEAAFGKELTDAHMRYLRTKLDGTYDTHCTLVADQQFFIDTAATCTFAGFVTACDYWLQHIDPDGKEPKDQLDTSRLHIAKGRGGRGEIEGACDAITAQTIKTAVDHEANKLRRSDKQAGIERTDSQRRMAALANLVARGFARDNGTYPVPLANIVMSLKVAEWALATLTSTIEPTNTVPVHHTDIDGRCELIDGTPIHPFLAVKALGLIDHTGATNPTNLRRYIMEADSRLLDVSVNARIFPEWMRTATHVQSRGHCETPGCDSPYHWHEIDHVDPASNGGPTNMANNQTQCRPDNQAKGATTGHTAWRNKPPPPQHHRRRTSRKPSTDDDDPDDPANNQRF